MSPLYLLPRLKRFSFAFVTTLFLTLVVASSFYSLRTSYPVTAQGGSTPTPTPYYLPGLTYRYGLERPAEIAANTNISVGIYMPRGEWDFLTNLTLTNIVANEFNMIVDTPWFADIQMCPPRWMVDENYATATPYVGMQHYNEQIESNILTDNESPCFRALATAIANPTTWPTYEALAEPDYLTSDLTVAWAKREQIRGHVVYVYMNPIFWDLDNQASIQPYWFSGHILSETQQYIDWDTDERKTILQLMNEHVDGVIKRYCSQTEVFNGPVLISGMEQD